jgi:hypothetical protein
MISDFAMKVYRIPTKRACASLSTEFINGQLMAIQLYVSIEVVKFKNSLSKCMFEFSLALTLLGRSFFK